MENGEKLLNPEYMSLWRELQVAMTLIGIALLESLNDSDLQNHLRKLSSVCSDSKRKRQSQLHFFSSA
jgi:hypothetical protein